MTHTSISSALSRASRRIHPPRPGPSKGARLLFGIYYGDDDALRERIIVAIAAQYADTPDPRQRAYTLIGGWSRGKSAPRHKFRQILFDVGNIGMGSWDELVEAES